MLHLLTPTMLNIGFEEKVPTGEVVGEEEVSDGDDRLDADRPYCCDSTGENTEFDDEEEEGDDNKFEVDVGGGGSDSGPRRI